MVEVDVEEENEDGDTVTVTLPAVCHSMECGFTIIETQGEITAFTYDSDSNTVTMTGTSLPDNETRVQ
jgi:YD repeat-containing protein